VVLLGSWIADATLSSQQQQLPATAHSHILPRMFTLTDAQAATIRTAYEEHGELSAVVELRRLFPGITSIVTARECVRTIIDWPSLPVRFSRRRLKPASLRFG
jgi:hypothetical protein